MVRLRRGAGWALPLAVFCLSLALVLEELVPGVGGGMVRTLLFGVALVLSLLVLLTTLPRR